MIRISLESQGARRAGVDNLINCSRKALLNRLVKGDGYFHIKSPSYERQAKLFPTLFRCPDTDPATDAFSGFIYQVGMVFIADKRATLSTVMGSLCPYSRENMRSLQDEALRQSQCKQNAASLDACSLPRGLLRSAA